MSDKIFVVVLTIMVAIGFSTVLIEPVTWSSWFSLAFLVMCSIFLGVVLGTVERVMICRGGVAVREREERRQQMEVKCLEIRDRATFIPVICIRPVADNEAQRYLLRRDGYRADQTEHCIIMIDAQCRGVAYDCYHWEDARTKRVAHHYIGENWSSLKDGDVVDVEFINGETDKPKISERIEDHFYR